TVPESDVVSTGPMVGPAVSAARERRVEEQQRAERRPHYRVLPAMGRKGGERDETVERETEVREVRETHKD
ncbi:MAG TPA: hypothetical protein VMQ78_02335, partial [Candidatus Limnocylindria bacterium]|nr:hypothetical protein [Candidatus Limnocylindria bacterium]